MTPRPELPFGTVTFIFTDIEGSTKLLHGLGSEAYNEALAEHRRVLRDAFTSHGGVEVDTQGDAFFVAFPTAPGALAAARNAQDALADGPIRVRMGLHTGTPLIGEEGYVGADVHRAARIAAAGHGGQVLVSASTAALVEDSLLDLGPHRLKDLSAPERLFQAGDGDFPPLKTLYQTNLPVPLTPFLGRERELHDVVSLVGRPDVRMLTLTGPGGTGKTRLAVQAAGELGDRYPAGVWWVPLAPLRDARLVLETAGRAVGANDGLADHIADRSMMLVLDNFEQVVDAASEVAGLMAACPNLEVLVTSREALRVSGEHEYAVPPLAQPDAVELFVSRARAVAPDFATDGTTAETVGAICRRLDDLPLAIELAAARVKALSPEQLLERLERRLPLLTSGARDLPERQRTLRAAIEWSHELLSPDEHRLFARLAVFQGGSTLEAAETIAEADLDGLHSLVEKSLLRRRDERFTMLETIREFAAERLEASSEGEALRRRHSDFFTAHVEAAWPHLQLDESEWVERLERDHDNLRAVLDRLVEAGDAARLLDLVGRLYRFWYLRSHFKEGQRYLEAALHADDRPTLARARALSGASVMTLCLSQYDTAQRQAEESLALYRQLGDPWGQAYATMMVGNVLSDRGKDTLAAAVPVFEDAIQRFDDLGDEHFALIARFNLAWVVGSLGDPRRERALTQEVLDRARAAGDAERWRAPGPVERTVALAQANLAMLERDDGRLDEARRLMGEAIGALHRQGSVQEVAFKLSWMANVLALGGDADRAARLMAKSDELFEELGMTRGWWDTDRDEQTRDILRAALDEAPLEEATQQGRELSLDEAVALALRGGQHADA